MILRPIYCAGCEKEVNARLTDGTEIYPHRKDLSKLPFWRCDTCKNYVGCHHKTESRTRPLGCIPTKELMNARKHIHALLDPMWKNGEISRGELYDRISDIVGWKYHTANIRSVDEARKVYRIVQEIKAAGSLQ